MSETMKIRDLQETYLSTTSLTSAKYFFGDVTPEIASLFGPHVIALDGPTKT
jgi:hypothetical protein